MAREKLATVMTMNKKKKKTQLVLTSVPVHDSWCRMLNCFIEVSFRESLHEVYLSSVSPLKLSCDDQRSQLNWREKEREYVYVFELDEAEITKVRDGKMSRFHRNNDLNELHRLRAHQIHRRTATTTTAILRHVEIRCWWFAVPLEDRWA